MSIVTETSADAVPSGRNHRAGLDGLRGVAALVVVAGHAIGLIGVQYPSQFFLAVDFFFVLSGYVVALAYQERLRSGSMSFWRFTRLRIERLHPMLLLGIAITVFDFAQHTLRGYSGPPWSDIAIATLTGMFCIPWHPLVLKEFAEKQPLFPLDGPAWSLFVEYAVNLAFGLLVVRLNLRPLIAIVGFGAAILVAFVAYFGTMSVGFTVGEGWLSLARGVYPFFAGVLIYRMEQLGKLPNISFPWWLSAFILVAVLALPIPTPAPWIELPAIFILWPAIVICTRADRFGPRMHRLMLWAGAVSYPVYILHVPIIQPIAHYISGWSATYQAAAIVGELLLIVALAQLALSFYDIPVRQALKRLGSRRDR